MTVIENILDRMADLFMYDSKNISETLSMEMESLSLHIFLTKNTPLHLWKILRKAYI
jgi:hypothetical protein